MGKIIITGPGRSGTTFVIRMLTRLGFDTGFKPKDEYYISKLRAGCEWNVPIDFDNDSPKKIRRALDKAPRVLKSPQWSFVIKGMVAMSVLEVDHVLVPLRDIDIAAASRLDVGLDWLVDPTLTGARKAQDQASIMAMALGRVIEACYVFNIPCTMMKFPLFVQDMDYCYTKMKHIAEIEIKRGEFKKWWKKLANPDQIKWIAKKEKS
jgi:hypothetical protein